MEVYKRLRHDRRSRDQVADQLRPTPISDFTAFEQQEAERRTYESARKAKLGQVPDIYAMPLSKVDERFGKASDSSQSAKGAIYPFPPDNLTSVYDWCYNMDALRDSQGRPVEFRLANPAALVDSVHELLHPYDNISEDFIKCQNQLKFKVGLNAQLDELEQRNRDQFYELQIADLAGNSKTVVKFRNIDSAVNRLLFVLKIRNHYYFEDAIAAFSAYDKGGKGKISVSDIAEMCKVFNIVAPFKVIAGVMEQCDQIDRDGLLSFNEFWLFFNSDDLLMKKNCNGLEKYKSVVAKHVPPKIDLKHYETTSSKYIEHDLKTIDDGHRYGLPYFRIDLPIPKVKKSWHSHDYGESAGIVSIVNPTTFSRYGHTDADLMARRGRDEMETIFIKKGVLPDSKTFDEIWKMHNKNNMMSIEGFLQAMSDFAWKRNKLMTSDFDFGIY